MTSHDELLAKIEGYKEYSPVDYGQLDLINALRAMVKLHKPKPVWGSMEDAECEECSWRKHRCQYPCPTIEAVERELK